MSDDNPRRMVTPSIAALEAVGYSTEEAARIAGEMQIEWRGLSEAQRRTREAATGLFYDGPEPAPDSPEASRPQMFRAVVTAGVVALVSRDGSKVRFESGSSLVGDTRNPRASRELAKALRAAASFLDDQALLEERDPDRGQS